MTLPKKLDVFVEEVLHCPKRQCPFWQDSPGRYPKFSYGNPRSRVLAVFQNPGSPEKSIHGEANQELSRNIKTVSAAEMRRWSNAGITNWLYKLHGLPESLFNLNGKTFLDSYYITQAYRCPDPLQTTSSMVRQAQSHCSDHLAREFAIKRPRTVMAFGINALQAVANVVNPSFRARNLKDLFLSKTLFDWNGIRVAPLVHPDGFWKNPSIPKDKYLSTVRWYCDQTELLIGVTT